MMFLVTTHFTKLNVVQDTSNMVMFQKKFSKNTNLIYYNYPSFKDYSSIHLSRGNFWIFDSRGIYSISTYLPNLSIYLSNIYLFVHQKVSLFSKTSTKIGAQWLTIYHNLNKITPKFIILLFSKVLYSSMILTYLLIGNVYFFCNSMNPL